MKNLYVASLEAYSRVVGCYNQGWAHAIATMVTPEGYQKRGGGLQPIPVALPINIINIRGSVEEAGVEPQVTRVTQEGLRFPQNISTKGA